MTDFTYSNETVRSYASLPINQTIFASWTNDVATGDQKIGFTATYVMLFLIAMLGNAFVIHVARKLLPTRGPFNLLVIYMAACDILYALTVVLDQLFYGYVDYSLLTRELRTFLCKFPRFSLLFAIDSSIFTLTAMTVERYLAIVPRIKKTLTKRNVVKVIGVILAFSCLHSTTELYKMNTKSRDYQNTTITVCYTMWSDDRDTADKLYKAEMVTKFVVDYAIPIITMVTLYYFIIRFLWLRKIPGNRTERNEIQKQNQLKKVILMLVTIATTFAITWFPAHVVHYYYAFNSDNSLPSYLQTLLFWVAHTNCATNPCFYLIFNKEYREELRRIAKQLKSYLICCSS